MPRTGVMLGRVHRSLRGRVSASSHWCWRCAQPRDHRIRHRRWPPWREQLHGLYRAVLDGRRPPPHQRQECSAAWARDATTREAIAESLVREASQIAGLSVVKATGPSEYVNDYIAYATIRKLLPPDPNSFCDDLVSVDAYRHWFDERGCGAAGPTTAACTHCG